jgi:hypothetical protein
MKRKKKEREQVSAKKSESEKMWGGEGGMEGSSGGDGEIHSHTDTGRAIHRDTRAARPDSGAHYGAHGAAPGVRAGASERGGAADPQRGGRTSGRGRGIRYATLQLRLLCEATGRDA